MFEMATQSAYQYGRPATTVPAGFPQILRDLTREILRAQPDNIYEFAAKYFASAVAKRQAASTSLHLQAEAVAAQLARLFREKDPQQTGCLPAGDAMKILTSFEPALSRSARYAALASAVFSADAQFDYRASQAAIVDSICHPLPGAEVAHPEFDYVRGMRSADLAAAIGRAFASAGTKSPLTSADVRRAVLSLDIGLTHKEQAVLVFEVCCRYGPEVAVQVLQSPQHLIEEMVEIIAFTDANRIDPIRRQSASEWSKLLADALKTRNAPASLARPQLRQALLASDIGISSKELLVVLAAAEEDATTGLIACAEFTEQAGKQLHDWFNPTVLTAELLKRAEKAAPSWTRSSVESALRTAFSQVDQAKLGRVARAQVRPVLTKCSLGLSPFETNGLLALVTETQDGYVYYSDVIAAAYDVLTFLQQQEAIRAMSEATAQPSS